MEQIKGKYLLERRLGCGGMAEVFVGRALGIDGFSRKVAIKRILPERSRDPGFRQMFADEARLGSLLAHGNIVSVLDFDQDEAGCLFLVMEYVDGIDLDGLMKTGLLPLPVVLSITVEILRGLEHAHDLPLTDGGPRGLVHRDISPQNVLLSWDGAVRISDFGIAKARAATQASASVLIKGKAAYMSPEQVQGAPLDGRSDLFAVGIMLWEMLCGAPLFHHGDRIEATLAAVLFGDVPSPRSRRPDLPGDIERVTMRLLEKPRERRFQNASAALAELSTCAEYPRGGREALAMLMAARLPDRAPRRGALAPVAPEVHPAADDSPQAPRVTVADPPRRRLPTFADPYGPAIARRADRPRRGRRRLALLAAGVAAGVTLGAVLHVLSGRDAEADRSAPSTPPLTQPGTPSPSTPAPSPPATSPQAPRSVAEDTRAAGAAPISRDASPAAGSAQGSGALARSAQPKPRRAPAERADANPREHRPQPPQAESGFQEIDLRAASSD